MVLVVVGLIPVLGLWFAMSRVRRCRWVVAGVIVGIAVVAAVLLGWVAPRARLEIQLAAPLAGVLAVIGGRLAERRILGPARRAAPPYVLGICVATTSFIVLWAGVPVTFHPDAGTVLPLPDGMRATAAPHDDGACDSIACVSTIEVSAAGRSGDEMKAELTRHLRARGWGSGCRPTGWLLDGSTECVEISVRDGGATIRLSGNRENVREQTLSFALSATMHAVRRPISPPNWPSGIPSMLSLLGRRIIGRRTLRPKPAATPMSRPGTQPPCAHFLVSRPLLGLPRWLLASLEVRSRPRSRG